jgi:hypothetical protein
MRPRISVPLSRHGFGSRRPAMAFAFAALLVLAPPRSARAAWQNDGVPLSPMPTALQSNTQRGLVADGAGGAFTVWEFEETDPYTYSYHYALRAQRVDQAGNRPAPWAAGGSTIRTWADDAANGTYAMTAVGLYPDGSGGALLAALDQVFIVEYQTLFRLYGIGSGGAVTAITIQNSTLGGYPVLAAGADGDASGGAVMIGLQQTFAPPPDSPPPSPLFAQRLSSAGAPLWPQDPGTYGVPLCAAGQAATDGLAALSDGAGGGFFAWTDTREPGDPDLYVQHLEASGALASGWPAGGVLVCGAAGNQLEPHLALDGAGGVFVLWRDDRSGNPRLYGHLVLAGGTLAPGIPGDGRQIPSSDASDAIVGLAGDGQGGLLVARAAGGITHLHRLGADLTAHAGWPDEGVALNTIVSGDGSAGFAPDGLGGAYACFRNGFGSTAPQGLYAQHYAADGSIAPGWSASGYRLSGTGQTAAIVRSGPGAIVAWDDARSSYRGVYAQSLLTDGPVPVELALVSAAASARGVALRWYSADGAGLLAALERSVNGAGFELIAEIALDGTGNLEYEDTAVTPGTRYGYRLRWHDGTVERTSAETWITVPRELALALDAPSPNPSRGAVVLAITLPDARGASLGVFDIAGRRIVARDLAGLSAGRHIVPLREAAALAPGLYVVELTQAGVTLRTRLVRIR